MTDPEQEGPRYRVEETERAEADREVAFLRLMNLLGPDYAARWYKDLRRTIDGIARFPGPRSHPVDESESHRYGYEVRRMLYRGPSGRGATYRVLFTVRPREPDDDEAVVRVLRIVHGARDPDQGEEEA